MAMNHLSYMTPGHPGGSMSALSTYLRAQIEARGWTQEHAAEIAGIQPSTLSSLINQPEREPKLSTLVKLADALELPLATLLEQAGYSVERGSTPEALESRIATLLKAAPWMTEVLDDLAAIPPSDQEDLLTYMELQRERRARRHRRSRTS